MNILNSLPYIAGLLLQGEAGLMMWFLYFVNQPKMWEWICIIAVIISNISFMFYFFAGYYAEKFLNLQEKIHRIAAKLGKPSFKMPQTFLIIIMRFLFFIMNPIAVYLGIKKYKPWKFILYNFAGSILWIAVWFSLFYLLRAGIHQLLQDYSRVLYLLYIVFLVIWVIVSLEWSKVKKILFKHN